MACWDDFTFLLICVSISVAGFPMKILYAFFPCVLHAYHRISLAFITEILPGEGKCAASYYVYAISSTLLSIKTNKLSILTTMFSNTFNIPLMWGTKFHSHTTLQAATRSCVHTWPSRVSVIGRCSKLAIFKINCKIDKMKLNYNSFQTVRACCGQTHAPADGLRDTGQWPRYRTLG